MIECKSRRQKFQPTIMAANVPEEYGIQVQRPVCSGPTPLVRFRATAAGCPW